MTVAAKKLALCCKDVDVVIAERTLLRGLKHQFAPGTVTAVLGQNGAGKTTTLHTLAGLRRAGRGSIELGEKTIADWPRRQLARSLGLLMQGYELAFPTTVLAAVLVGRHPHIGLLQWEGASDLAVARAALADVGLEGLEHRHVETLSGGEKRRLAIATLLAQETAVVMLDEPVANLDPRFQIMMMRLLRKLANAGRTVVLSLHDVNLARAHCDNALLIYGNGDWHSGACGEVINPENLRRLYATEFAQANASGLPFFYAA